jgi:hypothetical protein
VQRFLVGTASGLFELGEDSAKLDPGSGERDLTAGAVGDGEVLAVAERRTVLRRDPTGAWEELARASDLDLTCVLPTAHGVFAGTEEAHLLRLEGGALFLDDAFEKVEGRDGWYTPWGGAPAVRSIAADLAGRLHVNVHVGGIPRSTDGGATWEPTIDVDADVHQVIAHPTEPDVVLAAGAVGLAVSEDGGATWRIERTGLGSTYARAVAVAGDTALLSVSDGPRGGRAGVYRTTFGSAMRFDKCTEGLPEWFDRNIDSGWLSAAGTDIAFATSDGDVFVSEDTGERWRKAADSLPSIRWLSFA